MARYSLRKRVCSIAVATTLVGSMFSGIPAFQVKADGVTYYGGNFDAEYAYSGDDLGCNYTASATTFKVWAPTASTVKLIRYEEGSGSNKIEEVAMSGGGKSDKGVWSCTVDGDILNTYYTYSIDGREACDLYANSVGVNGNRAMVIDMDGEDAVPSKSRGDETNWDTNYKRSKQRLSDMVTWEVHVRDFSYSDTSGVKDEYQGKYLAFTQKGTTLQGETNIKTGIDYLKELGVTHVQILPMYDYGSVDETNSDVDSAYNWGYDPKNFNAPEGSYSTDATDGNVRVKELREMVQALHDAGIKVIMDVVYNHTFMDGANEAAWFDETVPKYYYRTNNTSSNGTYTNGSGCGNEVRTESAMGRKYIIDSLVHWAKDYNLDGFRFDLMGLYDVDTMNQIRSTLDKEFGEGTIVLYGEGWTGGTSGINGTPAMKENVRQLNNVGYFNDQIRDAAKGEGNMGGFGSIGLAQQNYKTGSYLADKWPDNVYGGIKGSVGKSAGEWWMWRAYWSDSSDKVVSYASCHDNLSLWDKLVEGTTKDDDRRIISGEYNSTDDKYIRMNRVVGGYILTSHGGSFMQAGEEFARSKQGYENSYNSPSSINAIDWSRLKTYSAVQEYYQGMIALRKAFSGFRNELTESGNNDTPKGSNFTWIDTDGTNSIAYYLSNSVADEWNEVAVMINNTTASKTYKLDHASSWVLVSDGEKASIDGVKTVNSSSVTVPAKSVAVAVPKDTYDANIAAIKKNIQNQPIGSTNTTTITCDKEVQGKVGEEISFLVSAVDSDGNAVNLTASNLPEGATFDSASGMFVWKQAVEGSYQVKFTAADGTSATVQVKVQSNASGLNQLLSEIEAENLKESDFTKEVWQPFQTACEEAKAVSSDASEEACETAQNKLQSAYNAVKKEKTAREALNTYVSEAAQSISEAGSANEQEMIEDAKTVLQKAKDLLQGTASAKAYTVAKENLEDSVNALVIGADQAVAKITTPWTASYIYIFKEKGTSKELLSKDWPGDALTEKDADGAYTYELPEGTGYSIIVNNGGKGEQSDTITAGSDKGVEISISNQQASTDSLGNKVMKTTSKEQPVGATTPEITKERLETALQEAKGYDETYYEETSYQALQTAIANAEEVKGNSDATQLEINRATRALRQAELQLTVKSGVILPTDTPVPAEPTETTAPPVVTATSTPTAPVSSPTGTTSVNRTAIPRPTATVAPQETEPAGEQLQTTPPDLSASIIPATTVPAEIQPTATATPTVTPVTSVQPTQTAGTSNGTSDDQTIEISRISVSPSLCQVVNKATKFTVEVAGTSDTLQYAYEVRKGDTVIDSQDFSTDPWYRYTASKAGTYSLRVTVKDSQGNTVSEDKKFVVVAKKLAVKLNYKVKKAAKKSVVKVRFAGSGGSKSYKYKYQILNGAGAVCKKSGYSSKKSCTWNMVAKGVYRIRVTVKDSTGTTATKTLRFRKK